LPQQQRLLVPNCPLQQLYAKSDQQALYDCYCSPLEFEMVFKKPTGLKNNLNTA